MAKILIIGGGVIGLAIAREFHKRGELDITIIEKDIVGSGASIAAAGMLSPQAESNIENNLFHFCLESSRLYPEFTSSLFDETGVDTCYEPSGTLYLSFNDHDSEELLARYAWQSKLGLEVEKLSPQETHKREPFASPDSIGSLFFPNDRQVDNRELLKALTEFCLTNAVKIILDKKITAIDNSDCFVRLHSSQGETFEGDVCVIAAGAWSSQILINGAPAAFPELIPVRGQMISFHTAKRLFKHVLYSSRGYVVPRKSGWILGGATIESVGFDSITTAEGIKSVSKTTFEIAPAISNLRIEEAWAGLRPSTADGLPLIGAIGEAKNLFVASAHYRNGILLAPMTANVLADKIIDGRDSKWLDCFTPNRHFEVEG